MKLVNVTWRKKAQINQVIFDISVYQLGDIIRDIQDRNRSPSIDEFLNMLGEAFDQCEEPK